MRRLGHVDENGLVLTKGRAACEIDAADELLTTELMFNGVFSKLDKHQVVALASCLVPLGEKSVVSFYSQKCRQSRFFPVFSTRVPSLHFSADDTQTLKAVRHPQ